jgi:ATP-dependent Clp protease adapter protein ClpS
MDDVRFKAVVFLILQKVFGIIPKNIRALIILLDELGRGILWFFSYAKNTVSKFLRQDGLGRMDTS